MWEPRWVEAWGCLACRSVVEWAAHLGPDSGAGLAQVTAREWVLAWVQKWVTEKALGWGHKWSLLSGMQ